jgi:hypothetical protein
MRASSSFLTLRARLSWGCSSPSSPTRSRPSSTSYPSREEAEAELRDALSDEPEWVDILHVEPFQFETSPN